MFSTSLITAASTFLVLLLFCTGATFTSAQLPGTGSSSASGASMSGSGPDPIPVPTDPVVPTLDFRLNGAGGTLQVYNQSTQTWLTVCSDFLLVDPTAMKICGFMGFGSAGASVTTGSVPGSGGAWVSDLDCPSTAVKAADCSWGTAQACKHESAVMLKCGAQVTTQFNFSVRAGDGLLLATNQKSGITGTVCNDGFSSTTAQGICKLLGTPAPAAGSANHLWWTLPTLSTAPIVLESVNCSMGAGTTSWADCNYKIESDCNNLEAVALDCTGNKLNVHFSQANLDAPLMVKPAGASQAVFGVLGSVKRTTAQKLCWWMGFDNQTATPSFVSAQASYVFFSKLDCPASAVRFQDCTYELGVAADAATTQNVVRLDCGDTRLDYDVAVLPSRLLQVRPKGSSASYGTVCGMRGVNFNITTATGVCKILTGAAADPAKIAWWNLPGTGSILLDDLTCPANAAAISGCAFDTNTDFCSHQSDVALACDTTQPAQQFAFKLNEIAPGTTYAQAAPPGAPTAFSGICGDNIDLPTARFLCAASGAPTAVVTWTFQASVTAGAATTLKAVKCPVGATSFYANCSFSQAGACTSVLRLTCSPAPTPAPTTPTPPVTSPPPPAPTTTTTLLPVGPTPPPVGPTPPPVGPTPPPVGPTPPPTPVPANTVAPTAPPTPAPPQPTAATITVTASFNATVFVAATATLLGIPASSITVSAGVSASARVVTFGSGAQGTQALNSFLQYNQTNLPASLAAAGVSSVQPDEPTSAPAPPASSKGNGGAIAGGIIAGLVVIGLVAFFLTRKKDGGTGGGDDGRGTTTQFHAGQGQAAAMEYTLQTDAGGV